MEEHHLENVYQYIDHHEMRLCGGNMQGKSQRELLKLHITKNQHHPPPPLPYLFDDNALTEKWANKDNEISREKNLCNKPILRDDQAFVKHSACWSMRKK